MASTASGGETKKYKKSAVAGSFLFKFPDGDAKRAQVALFRRSDKVSTYRHKLAPVSGSVEKDDASPMATALREIQEETTLTPSSLELLHVGKPYSFIDESIGRVWTINPFAFRLKDKAEGGKGEEGIVIDWEHDGVEWYNPLEVNESDEFGGVLKLVESLRRVWPEYDLGTKAGKVLTSGLQRLRDDHESGARQLAAAALSTLKDLIAEMNVGAIDETWWANVRMAAWHICKTRESMGAAILTAIVKALDRVEAIFTRNLAPAEKVRQMVEATDDQLAQRQSTSERICNSFVDYIHQNVIQGAESKNRISVLTLSSSSTISACLLQAAARLGVALDLRVLESRPLCEGVTLASKLLEEDNKKTDLTVTLYSDASAALGADAVDILVLGADRISSAGDVSNKIGSLPAILSQRHVASNAKVVILSESEKVAGLGPTSEHPVEENDPRELTQAWKGNVKGAHVIEDALRREANQGKVRVNNTYFEWIPARFISAYVTDEGVWSVEDIGKRSVWISNETDRFFKDL
ncbi:nagb/rpia/CoA transferase-like protein [Xylariaceae sp. FL0662B]|nr:nagb/rpia/CoA transferase-like protein [Xylariaceae sp. FL0662B]